MRNLLCIAVLLVRSNHKLLLLYPCTTLLHLQAGVGVAENPGALSSSRGIPLADTYVSS
jgi:hypothetical protein